MKKNLKEYTKVTKLLTEVSNVTRYKANMQISIAFLCTSNEQLGVEINEKP